MSKYYENGLKKGKWTKEDLDVCGWENASECLEHEVESYEEEIRKLALKPFNEHNKKQFEFLEGIKQAAISSLRELIAQGY